MKEIVIILFSFNLSAQITYFNSASTPADNGTSGVSPITVTPPGSMTAGDLVYVFCHARNAAATITNTTTGGQTWNALADINSTAMTGKVFWCRYSGTWAADPGFSSSNATSFTAVMHVFRPAATSAQWAVNVGQVEQDHAASDTISIWPGQTTTKDTCVTISAWLSADDNTWGSLNGTGWAVTGGAQYRNTDSQDMSSTFAHYLRTSAGATGVVRKTELTLGNDDTTSSQVTFYSFTPVVNTGLPLYFYY